MSSLLRPFVCLLVLALVAFGAATATAAFDESQPAAANSALPVAVVDTREMLPPAAPLPDTASLPYRVHLPLIGKGFFRRLSPEIGDGWKLMNQKCESIPPDRSMVDKAMRDTCWYSYKRNESPFPDRDIWAIIFQGTFQGAQNPGSVEYTIKQAYIKVKARPPSDPNLVFTWFDWSPKDGHRGGCDSRPEVTIGLSGPELTLPIQWCETMTPYKGGDVRGQVGGLEVYWVSGGLNYPEIRDLGLISAISVPKGYPLVWELFVALNDEVFPPRGQ